MSLEERSQNRLYSWALLAMGAFALGLSWSVIALRRFDGLYGQDAFAYYDYALRLWESLRQGRRPPPFFWPVGYPALMAALFPLTGVTSRAGQVISSLAGAGVVLLSAGLVRRLFEQEGASREMARWAGLIAGGMTLASGQLGHWSLTVMSDTAALFWGTLTLWAAVRYGDSGRLRWVLLTAVALAGAVLTRWVYALLVLPVGLYGAWVVRTHGRRVLAHALFGGCVGLALLVPPIVLLHGSDGTPPWRHPWWTGWSLGNALRRTLDTVDGHAEYPLPVALFYAKAVVSPRALFPLWTPFFVLGLGAALRHRWVRTLALLGGWGTAMYGFLAGIPYQNFRFVLALLPATVGFTAIGLDRFGFAGPTRPAVPRWRRWTAEFCLAVGFLGSLAYNGRVVWAFIDRKDADVAVARWVEQTVPAEARVLAFGITLTLRHYTPRDVEELYGLTPADLSRRVREGRPLYLVVPLEDLGRQWRGRSPEQNYRWLRDGPGLIPLGTFHGYTLFRVRGR